MELKSWKSEAVSAKIRAIYSADKAMQPEQQQALKAHLQAIAKILYDDSDPDAMQTLEGIETTVRQKILIGECSFQGHNGTAKMSHKC